MWNFVKLKATVGVPTHAILTLVLCSTLARRSRESGYGIEVYGTPNSKFLRELIGGFELAFRPLWV